MFAQGPERKKNIQEHSSSHPSPLPGHSSHSIQALPNPCTPFPAIPAPAIPATFPKGPSGRWAAAAPTTSHTLMSHRIWGCLGFLQQRSEAPQEKPLGWGSASTFQGQLYPRAQAPIQGPDGSHCPPDPGMPAKAAAHSAVLPPGKGCQESRHCPWDPSVSSLSSRRWRQPKGTCGCWEMKTSGNADSRHSWTRPQGWVLLSSPTAPTDTAWPGSCPASSARLWDRASLNPPHSNSRLRVTWFQLA